MQQLGWKKSVLVISKTLGLFVNTSTADDKYSLLNKDNFNAINSDGIIQETKNFFSILFAGFLKFTLPFQYFEQKDNPHRLCILEITDRNRRA